LPEQRRRAALRVPGNTPDDLCERITCAPIASMRDYSLWLMFKKRKNEKERKRGEETARDFSFAKTCKISNLRVKQIRIPSAIIFP